MTVSSDKCVLGLFPPFVCTSALGLCYWPDVKVSPTKDYIPHLVIYCSANITAGGYGQNRQPVHRQRCVLQMIVDDLLEDNPFPSKAKWEDWWKQNSITETINNWYSKQYPKCQYWYSEQMEVRLEELRAVMRRVHQTLKTTPPEEIWVRGRSVTPDPKQRNEELHDEFEQDSLCDLDHPHSPRHGGMTADYTDKSPCSDTMHIDECSHSQREHLSMTTQNLNNISIYDDQESEMKMGSVNNQCQGTIPSVSDVQSTQPTHDMMENEQTHNPQTADMRFRRGRFKRRSRRNLSGTTKASNNGSKMEMAKLSKQLSANLNSVLVAMLRTYVL